MPNQIQNSFHPIICFIEGNIGSGKSTFLDMLKKYHINAQFFQEPVDEWRNTMDESGNNVLSYFYKDMEKYCYMFQSYAFITRVNQLDQLDMTKDIIFIERSIFSDRNVFAKTCHDTKLLNDIEWITYNTWFDNMLPKYKHIFDNAFYIYLKVSPNTALQRINKRSRTEENKIELSYLELLHQKHEDWLQSNTINNKHIIIDAEKNLLNNDEFKSVLELINVQTKANRNI